MVAIAVARGTDPEEVEQATAHDLLDLLGIPPAGVFAPLSLQERVAALDERASPPAAGNGTSAEPHAASFSAAPPDPHADADSERQAREPVSFAGEPEDD